MTGYQIIAAIVNIPVDKAREILALADFRLSELARWDMERWLIIPDIVYVKASALVTSLELCRIRMFEQPDRKIRIHCSQDAYNCMKPFL